MSGRRACVITASTRAAAGRFRDTTGPTIVSWLRERGYATDDALVVADGPGIGELIESALAGGADVVLTSGGTGPAPDDQTPEQTRPLLDRELPGIMEEIRRRGMAATKNAILTRGCAGLRGASVVVNLPGSTGGVADGLAVLDEVLEHIHLQLQGAKHG